MKILFYRYNSICEPDMIEAFRHYGLSVEEETNEMTVKSLSHQDRIRLIQKRFDAAGNEPFLFVFSFNFFPAISDICQIYNTPYVCWSVDAPLSEIYSKSIKNACNRLFLFDKQQYASLKDYNPDCIFHLPLCTNTLRWDQVIDSINNADRAKYSSDISFVGSLYTEKDPWLDLRSLAPHTLGFAEGLMEAQKSLVGCNILEDSLPEKVACEITEACPKRFADDAFSVKPMHTYVAAHHILGMHTSSLFRINAFSQLAEQFAVTLYTRSPIPETLLPCLTETRSPSDDSRLIDSVSELPGIRLVSGADTLTEMPKIFHLSKINLNLTIYPIQSGLSLRIWDVLGCGGFLLTNIQPELTDYFTPGEDLDTFSCMEELLDKCAFYLAHETLRKKIAQSGCQKVRAHHTWQTRFTEMLQSILPQ